ncbi:hypothetical protein ACP4OV_020857 [Aristida adscensionis]
MAIDQQPHIKRRRGRPPGSKCKPPGSQSAKSKMEQKMALVKQRMALLASSSSSGESESDNDGDSVPMDDELAIVVAQQPVATHCGDKEDGKDAGPMQVVRPKEVESEQRKIPSVPQINSAQNTAKAPDFNGQNLSASNCGSAMARAKEIEAKLPAKHPSFIKNMLQSHVVRGFWLGLPTYFCNKYLPKHDTDMVLEDENGVSHCTTYLGLKQGLSAGWRGFAIKHGIKVDDIVVFQLVKPTKFKVYIVRANEFTTADGALSLLSLEGCKKRKLKEEISDNVSKEAAKAIIVNEAIDGIRFSDSEIDFDEVKSFSSFNIIVDSLIIDCKFNDQARRTYYELCCSQKCFIHKHLLKQLNLGLVVGVIMETINIAEGIRACKAQSSSWEDFLIWKKTLESFELLGMNVAFLLKRVNDLLGLPTQSRDLSECQRYKELKLERAQAGKKVKALELQLSNVKGTLQEIDADMEEMEASVKRSCRTLQQLAAAPW